MKLAVRLNLAVALIATQFVTGCKTTQPHDTAQLTRNIGNARTGVTEARRSTDALAGNVGRARTGSSRIDAKAQVILRWFDAQGRPERRP